MEPVTIQTRRRTAEIHAALQPVWRFNRERRARAARVLGALRPEDVECLIAIIRRERALRTRLKRAAWAAASVAPIALVVEMVMARLLSMPPGSAERALTSLLWMPVSVAMSPGPVCHGATQMLARYPDRDLVGYMADVVAYRNKAITASVRPALISVLPRLRREDAWLLNRRQRAALNCELARAGRSQPMLALAILAAWEQVGDASCIPAVRKLARAKSRDRISPAVVARAQECLPLLTSQGSTPATQHELLRATGTAPDGGATLLRAGGTQAGAEAELLRPGDARGRGDEESAETAVRARP